jgi:hypothetical protein
VEEEETEMIVSLLLLYIIMFIISVKTIPAAEDISPEDGGTGMGKLNFIEI